MGRGVGAHLDADCARGLGRAEVAVRRREPGIERAGHLGISLVGGCAGCGNTRGSHGRLFSGGLFDNPKVQIDTSIGGLARLVKGTAPAWLIDGLKQIDAGTSAYASDCRDLSGVEGAKKLVPVYRETLDLYARVKQSNLDAEAKVGSRV